MMLIKLTLEDGTKILLNKNQIISICDWDDDLSFSDEKGTAKSQIYAVPDIYFYCKESPEEILEMCE